MASQQKLDITINKCFTVVVIPWRVWQARVQECFAFVSVLCFDIHVPRPAWPAFISLMSVRVCVCLVSGLGVVLNNPRDAQHHKTKVQWQEWFRWQRRGCVWVCVYGEGDLTGGEARPQVVKWRRWSIEKGVWGVGILFGIKMEEGMVGSPVKFYSLSEK